MDTTNQDVESSYQINENFEFHLHGRWHLDIHFNKAMIVFFSMSEAELDLFTTTLKSIIVKQLFEGEDPHKAIFYGVIRVGEEIFEFQFDERWQIVHNGMFLWLETSELILFQKFLDKRNSSKNWAEGC